VTGFLELSFDLGTLDAAAAEEACLACGASAVTFVDAADEPVLEPLPGELRLWRSTQLRALFSAELSPADLVGSLSALLGLDPARLQLRQVADRAWEREWLRDFHALRFGRRLWICPRHERVEQPDAVVVRLDPGLAFGTGSHPSTALCLQWLDAAPLAGSIVIDYGCGAGALAIAALKLGAQRAYAFDIDPQALLATGENAIDNGVADRLQLCERASDLPLRCDVLLANILAEVLVSLREPLSRLLPPGGRCLLAGILADQEPEVAAAFMKWFDIRCFAQREGWVALAGIRC
jgi:ribosomal protein L11 methyltransferase